MKRIIEMLKHPMGVAAIGLPVSSIRTSVHTIEPDVRVPAGKWHEVLYSVRQQIQDKLNEN